LQVQLAIVWSGDRELLIVRSVVAFLVGPSTWQALTGVIDSFVTCIMQGV